MSQSVRQSELFAGSDWRVLYRAFTEVNFNASDPPSINRALREYIQTNYPENFNDWIGSSEFVAIIDLLSWLAGTLAFKTDINAREAFLETAESRESILRLARFISYNPRRNSPGTGIVKLVEVMTDDDVVDGFGVNLNNSTIQWDNPDDPDWFERFVLVLNSAFISTNKFGVPLKKGVVGAAKTQLYRLNNRMSEMQQGFSAKVSGQTMDFEVVNADFEDGGGFFERAPNQDNAFHLFYRNDGNGNASTQTGFFMLFKQGTTRRDTYALDVPVENRVLDINTQGVNQNDVWVQTVSDTGTVLTDWSKVPAIFNENITYNNYATSVRNIFSVVTRDNDEISIRFSDGRFGSVPVGNIRVWYRVSNGLQYQIRPADFTRIKLPIPYYNRKGVRKTLTLTFSLQEPVSNSTPRETEDQIKARAPAVYSTQNRMVSGEDYNTFPLQSNLAIKLKAINRVYSGHSRFIDLNDPTGNYQDLNVFSDDGIYFKEFYNTYTEVPLSLSPSAGEIMSTYLQPLLDRVETANFVREKLRNAFANVPVPGPVIWRKSSEAAFSSTGSFSTLPESLPYFTQGAMLLFRHPTEPDRKVWTSIGTVLGDPIVEPPLGTAGPVTLASPVDNGWIVERIIPAFSSGLPISVANDIEARISDNTPFTLWFNYSGGSTPMWEVGGLSTELSHDADHSDQNRILVMAVEYSDKVWRATALGFRYIFESLKSVHWYNDGRRSIDQETGLEQDDLIRVLRVNEDPTGRGRGLPKDYDLAISRIYLNRDGTANPKRVTVRLLDDNMNGAPDTPDLFERVVHPGTADSYLFWQNSDSGSEPLIRTVHMFARESDRLAANLPAGTIAFQIGNETDSQGNPLVPAVRRNTFWSRVLKRNEDGTTEIIWKKERAGAFSYGIGRGPNVAATYTAPLTPKPPNAPGADFWWEEVPPGTQSSGPTDPDPTSTTPQQLFKPTWRTTDLGGPPTGYPQEPYFGPFQFMATIPDVLNPSNTFGTMQGVSFKMMTPRENLPPAIDTEDGRMDFVEGTVGAFGAPPGVGTLRGVVDYRNVVSDPPYTFTIRAYHGDNYNKSPYFVDRTFTLKFAELPVPTWQNEAGDTGIDFTTESFFGPMLWVATIPDTQNPSNTYGTMQGVKFELKPGHNLPSELIFKSGVFGKDPGAGTLSGQPTAASKGKSYTFTIIASTTPTNGVPRTFTIHFKP